MNTRCKCSREAKAEISTFWADFIVIWEAQFQVLRWRITLFLRILLLEDHMKEWEYSQSIDGGRSSREETHRIVWVVLLHFIHELQVALLLVQGGHLLLAVLQPLLRVGQLVPQPGVLLAEASHLRSQLLLLRLHVLQVVGQCHHHLPRHSQNNYYTSIWVFYCSGQWLLSCNH